MNKVEVLKALRAGAYVNADSPYGATHGVYDAEHKAIGDVQYRTLEAIRGEVVYLSAPSYFSSPHVSPRWGHGNFYVHRSCYLEQQAKKAADQKAKAEASKAAEEASKVADDPTEPWNRWD
jgi:hypothetical protein